MKGKGKFEDKKWLFLGSAILLATVVITVILNLPIKSNDGIYGGSFNAAVISSGTEVTIKREAPTGTYKSFFAVCVRNRDTAECNSFHVVSRKSLYHQTAEFLRQLTRYFGTAAKQLCKILAVHRAWNVNYALHLCLH